MTKQKLPQLSTTQGVKDAPIRKLLAQIKEILETREGRRGDPLERVITLRDIQSGDLDITVNALSLGGGSSGGGTIPSGFSDLTVPPLPTGLTANGAFENIVLSWDYPAYSNHAYTRVYRSSTDNFGTATLIGSTDGTVYADNVGTNASRYYWITHVSLADVEGPIQSTAGVNGTTAPNVNYLRTELANAITETELYGALNSRIDLVDDATTGLDKQFVLKKNNKGHITGFGFGTTNPVDEAPYSDFIVQADRVSFVTPVATWLASTPYALNQFVMPIDTTGLGDEIIFKCTQAGTTGGTEPTWNTTLGQVTNDGGAIWTAVNREKVVPFVLSGSSLFLDTAYIENAAITDAKINTLNADKLFAASGTLASVIIGNGHITNAMIDSIIQSSNFSAGSAGWRINKNGEAEFHNVTIYDNSGNVIFQSGGRISNRTFVQTTAPTGDLLNGDIWIDTDDGNKVYVRESGAWTSRQDTDIATAQLTADGRNTTFAQPAQPTANATGDLWIDTDDKNKLYRWSGATWVSMRDTDIAQALANAATAQSTADGKITTFYQTTAPGSADEGDIWFDTDDGNKIYIRESGAWVARQDSQIASAINQAQTAQSTADGKAVTYYQTSAPTAEGVGDLWVDTDNGNRLYRWSGSSWIDIRDAGIAQAISDAANAQTTADGKIETFYQATAPGSASEGDIWFDTDDGNKIYIRESGVWVARQDSDIAAAINQAQTAQTTADGKAVTFYQATPPTAEGVGDLWVETDNGNRLYRWSGASWVDIRDSGITQAIADAAAAQSTADGKIETFYQTTAPGSASEGDIWFDTDDGNKIYIRESGAWVNRQDSQIASAINQAQTAQTTADGKAVTFYQTSAPTAQGTGDLWVDTDNGNRLYRWNGSSWVDIQDSDIPAAATTATWANVTGTGKPANDAQVNAPTIGLKINTRAFNIAENGEGYIHGFDSDGNATDASGYVWIDGAKKTVPKHIPNWASLISFATNMIGKGVLAFDHAASSFTVSGYPCQVAFARKNSATGNWEYDNQTAWTTFTPSSSMYVIGELETTATDYISTGTIFPHPLLLKNYTDPDADKTSENTAKFIDNQGNFATLNQITAGNVSTYIASAAISNAYIANATITGAKIASATIAEGNIASAAITNAKIGTAAVNILKISDESITGLAINSQPTSASVSGSWPSIISATVNINASAPTSTRVKITFSFKASFSSSNSVRVKRGTTILQTFSTEGSSSLATGVIVDTPGSTGNHTYSVEVNATGSVSQRFIELRATYK